ncbi:MAG: hypothetical protein EI684_03370 [Candidatus Viridilinea halotolerans]|uniref:Uncharacterized protein n=1 Tax=Candidatus Viridilinea halotolerans TaxID=2491704 RepID=A0A426U838_9CHLR|nr:MAG: hypothetical protein EI684_03370 [Candidatus Viridilinea halotolerans]
MNLNQHQARRTGILLIALGIVAIFNLWWLLPTALLAFAGITIYRREKLLGHTNRAVQGALWGLGLALLVLLKFIFPGVLLLGGVSLLIRGREPEVEARVWATLGRLGRRRTPAFTAQPTPPAYSAHPAEPMGVEQREKQPNSSETIRLH